MVVDQQYLFFCRIFHERNWGCHPPPSSLTEFSPLRDWALFSARQIVVFDLWWDGLGTTLEKSSGSKWVVSWQAFWPPIKQALPNWTWKKYNWGFDDYHEILMINDHYYNHDHSMVPPARPSPILLYMGLNDILTNGSVTGEEALLSSYRKKPNEKYHRGKDPFLDDIDRHLKNRLVM